MRSKALLAAVIGLVAGLGLPAAAASCSLVASTPKQRVRAADVALYGVVASVRMLDEPPAPGVPHSVGERFEARVRVTRVFKGATGRVIRVRGHTDEASCGIGELRPGRRLGLLLDRPGRPYQVSLGSLISLGDLRRATRGR